MKNSKTLVLSGALLIALCGAGCGKKKPPKGGDTPLSEDSGETSGIKIDNPRTAAEAPRPPIEEDIEGPLSSVYFDFDRYEIRADQRPTIEKNAAWLASHAAENVLIEGHCDERGTEEYNLALGEKRAHAARAYLQNLGIRPSRISTVSYGKARPLAMGQNEDAWARNRRAEFKVGGTSIR